MNTNERKPIRLTQLMTVLYETSYTREEALELLKKGNADKAMMLHAARREWPGIPNHDEADSAWLAAMGAAKLGHEPVEMTAWRVSGLTKGDWPLDGLETL